MSGSEALSPAFPRTFHFLSLTHSSKTCSTDSPGYPHCNCVYCQERNAAENREQSAPSTYEEFIHLQIILKQRERLEVYSSSSSPPSSTSTELSEDDVEENEHNYGVTGKFTPNFFPPENSIEKNIQTDTTRGIWEYNKKQAYVLQRGDVNRKRKFSDLEDVDESMEKSGMGGDGNTYSPDHAEEKMERMMTEYPRVMERMMTEYPWVME